MSDRFVAPSVGLLAVVVLWFGFLPSTLYAHHCGPTQPLPRYPNHSCRTHTQTWQPGETVDPHPGGAQGRGPRPTPGLGPGQGSGLVQAPSVHCQIEQDGQCHCGPRRGTGRNIPCIPGQQPVQDTCVELQVEGRILSCPKQQPEPSQTNVVKLCDLQRLAALIFERYNTGYPIATVRVTNSPVQNTYLVLLQGVEEDHIDVWQAAQGYLRQAATPELRLLENILKLNQGDRYRQAILEAVSQLPPRSTLLLAGHSLGGIEAQNLVEELMRRGFAVSNVFTFGSPVIGERTPGPPYLDVKALLGIPDLVAAADRGISLSIVRIHGGTSIDLWDTQHGSHHIYNKSAELEALGLDGKPKRPGGPCLELDVDSYTIAKAQRWPPCPDVSFKGRQPTHVTNQWSNNQAAKNAWTAQWQQAATLKTLTERKQVSERIGEAAMTMDARAHRYETLLSPGTASDTAQGFDAIYYDRSNDTYVIAEAKGGYTGKGLNYTLGYGYRCRQGTIDWVWRAAEQILTSGTTNSVEQQVAQQIMNRLRINRDGGRAPVRVEVFHTAHINGVPGDTKHYVTASSP